MKKFYLLIYLFFLFPTHFSSIFADTLKENMEHKENDGQSSIVMEEEVVTTKDENEIAEAQNIFNFAFDVLLKKHDEEHLKFPTQMIWLNGAPGAGKGTNTASVMRALEISTKPIEVSTLLSSPEAQAIKATGKLVDDKTVVTLVFEELLRPENARGVIIDGFPRTKIQALCLKMLINRLQSSEKNKWCTFKIINFTVSHETSVKRQLERGRLALEHNRIVEESGIGTKIPVRTTDLSREAADFRYHIYINEAKQSLKVLQNLVEYDEISAEGSLDEVRARICRILISN